MSSTSNDAPEPGEGPEPEADGAIGRWPFGLEAEGVEGPHVVVTLDTRTGGATFSGPYRTALGALCAADVEYQVDRDQGGRGELTFHVAALHAPIGSDDPDTPFQWAGASRGGHDSRPLAQVRTLLAAVAERTLRRRSRVVAGTVAVSAAACASGAGEGWSRRGRTPRYRHLLGRDPR
ncbi:hypothetical protein [Pedococcus bigeumensis]|uniref:hypothetical protein n=1 Tax=Pedococcus bigeumensis TaxID=433644 RepID=UPI002FE70999